MTRATARRATPFTVSGGSALPGSTPDPITGNSSPPAQQSFTYFPLYVLDINDGVVLYPGVDQLANFAAKVDLEAQVTGTTVSSYNWDTSGLGTDITNLSVTNTYQLTFNWPTTNPAPAAPIPSRYRWRTRNSHSETFTYDFYLPHGSGVERRLRGRQRHLAHVAGTQQRAALGPLVCQRQRHASMRPAAPSTPRSTCPATTRMFPPSR